MSIIPMKRQHTSKWYSPRKNQSQEKGGLWSWLLPLCIETTQPTKRSERAWGNHHFRWLNQEPPILFIGQPLGRGHHQNQPRLTKVQWDRPVRPPSSPVSPSKSPGDGQTPHGPNTTWRNTILFWFIMYNVVKPINHPIPSPSHDHKWLVYNPSHGRNREWNPVSLSWKYPQIIPVTSWELKQSTGDVGIQKKKQETPLENTSSISLP